MLDDLARDPGRAADLPPGARQAIVLTCSAIIAACAAVGSGDPVDGAPAGGAAEDRLLTVREAAVKLGVSTDHLYRHAGHYPFTVRFGTRVRFSLQGLERYCRQRQGRSLAR
jgi:excisionase family DNA binding protein